MSLKRRLEQKSRLNEVNDNGLNFGEVQEKGVGMKSVNGGIFEEDMSSTKKAEGALDLKTSRLEARLKKRVISQLLKSRESLKRKQSSR